MKRKLELRNRTNPELFSLYDTEVSFKHQSANGLREARRLLGHFHSYLGQYPPSAVLAKAFLSQFQNRKANTLARYVVVINGFMKWYGEPLDIKVKVPKMLPDYVESGDIEKLIDAMRKRKTHKSIVKRDMLLVKVAINTGLRRAELAHLKVRDIDIKEKTVIVRQGKGRKDRAIPLTRELIKELDDFIKGKGENDSVFRLTAASISGKIKYWANKAGVRIHTHSLRDHFATALNERGVSIRAIQELLGHSNLSNTERYILQIYCKY
jgi:integrase/recombinase XerD